MSPALNQIEAAIRDLIAQQRAAQGQGPEDHEISDLEAQEGMAFWAKTMFWATLAAVVLTFAGIVLIARTLYHTRRAADYTKGMLEEAKKTTAAAIAASDSTEASVKVASDTAKRELRAYVNVVESRVEFLSDNVVLATVIVRNNGKTPAKDLSHGITFEISRKKPGAVPIPDPEDYTSDLGPSVPTEWPISKSFDDLTWRKIHEHKTRLYVRGEIRYTDVFSDEHRTIFCLILDRGSDRLIAYHVGNYCD